MNRWRAGLLLSLSCTAAACLAADASGNYAIWGAGGQSCNQYLRTAGSADDRARFEHFLMGYLTAYNTLAPDTYSALGSLSLEDSLAWLDDYCDVHKIESFERAITQFVVARHAERLRTPPGTATGGWGRPAPSQAP